MEGRHVDVTRWTPPRTGIDDIRESSRRFATSRRSPATRSYIIDEVHMLSKQAINGLLKTLEEPPAHVKFIFAPRPRCERFGHILSRTQRFDLRRNSRRPASPI